MALLLSIVSAMLYGTADYSGGYATRSYRVQSVLLVSQLYGCVLALGAAFFATAAPSLSDLGWGALAGIAGSVGLTCLYTGISRSLVAVVSPVSAVLSSVLPLFFGLIVGEHARPVAWAGAALCLPATLLLSLDGRKGDRASRAAFRRALAYGAGAGAGFGLFYIAISRPAAEVGLWPLVAARVATVAAMGALTFVRGGRPELRAFISWPVVLAGVLDMGANIAFIAATHFGLLALVSVVVSLYPAPTVILARILLGERLGAARIAGVCLALAGVALISL